MYDLKEFFELDAYQNEVRNPRVAKSSYETKLRKMTSHSELLKFHE